MNFREKLVKLYEAIIIGEVTTKEELAAFVDGLKEGGASEGSEEEKVAELKCIVEEEGQDIWVFTSYLVHELAKTYKDKKFIDVDRELEREIGEYDQLIHA